MGGANQSERCLDGLKARHNIPCGGDAETNTPTSGNFQNCWARAMCGHAAEPPSSVMKSRRLLSNMGSPFLQAAATNNDYRSLLRGRQSGSRLCSAHGAEIIDHLKRRDELPEWNDPVPMIRRHL
jgi:hypothetical protein